MDEEVDDPIGDALRQVEEARRLLLEKQAEEERANFLDTAESGELAAEIESMPDEQFAENFVNLELSEEAGKGFFERSTE